MGGSNEIIKLKFYKLLTSSSCIEWEKNKNYLEVSERIVKIHFNYQ